MAMGQNPVRPVNISIPTKIKPKMGGEFTYPKMGSQNGFCHHCHFQGGISAEVPGIEVLKDLEDGLGARSYHLARLPIEVIESPDLWIAPEN